jgi:hypothetical protein
MSRGLGFKRYLGHGVKWIVIGISLLSAVVSYADSADEINASIQAKGARWFAKETPLSQVPSEEMRKWTGAQEDTALGGMAPDPAFYIPMSLPLSFDWTNHNGNFVTPVKNQSNCGSCWAFSTTAALESKVLITFDMPWVDLDLSEQIVLSCSGAGDCEKGGQAGKAADFLTNTGTYRESCYSYTAADGHCKQACAIWQTYPYKIDGWSYVVSGNVADISTIKNALFANGPLVAWFRVYQDFQSYSGGVYSYTTGNYTGSNHFVVIVGWDDARHALRCKNSWGTNWGESGFFWIDYKELYGTGPTEFGRYVYALGNALFTSPPTGPDLAGEWTSFSQTCKTSSRGQTCKISAALQVKNAGNQAASSYVEIYLSDGAGYLKRISTGKIKHGENKLIKISYNLPKGQSASGKYLLAVIDPDDTFVESNEKNNVIVSGTLQ